MQRSLHLVSVVVSAPCIGTDAVFEAQQLGRGRNEELETKTVEHLEVPVQRSRLRKRKDAFQFYVRLLIISSSISALICILLQYHFLRNSEVRACELQTVSLILTSAHHSISAVSKSLSFRRNFRLTRGSEHQTPRAAQLN